MIGVVPTDTTTAALVGGAASLVTLLISKWMDSGSAERRTIADDRREADRERNRELADCESSKEELRERCSALHAENAALKATLLARHIQLPPPSDPSPL